MTMVSTWRGLTGALATLLALAVGTAADKPGRAGGKDGGGGRGQGEARMPTVAFRTDVPAHPYDLILGRPTGESVTLSVLSYQAMRASVVWRKEGESGGRRLPGRDFPAGQPVELKLDALTPGTAYVYQLIPDATSGVEASPEHRFVTARLAGQSFTFTIQADSHLDFGTDPALYHRALEYVTASGSDFHIDLGDTFMTDKRTDHRDALPQYLAQRYYLGLVGSSAPVFLVLGNHDGEQPGRGGSGPDSMTAWSNTTRRLFFPNPVPDGFYSGNSMPHPSLGLLQDYYAWEWGDALFVVLDPFWFSTGHGRNTDNWSRTLGREQYDWLRRTLEESRARYRFVFIHHLVGGETREGRGGAEAARFFEWGGRDLDGRDAFQSRRPGWPRPIHDLLVAHHVNVVFHGHDHFFAEQELDGIIYQELPQPGHPRPLARNAAEYGYRSGNILPGSGIIRVRVEPDQAVIEFLRVDQGVDQPAHSRTILPR